METQVVKYITTQILGMLTIVLVLSVASVAMESCVEKAVDDAIDMALDSVEDGSAVAK